MTEDLKDIPLSDPIPYEQMLLGSILLNPDCFNYVSDFLEAEHFSDPMHHAIYDLMKWSAKIFLFPDILIIKDLLRSYDAHEDWFEYLDKLTTLSMIVMDPKAYGELIRQAAEERKRGNN